MHAGCCMAAACSFVWAKMQRGLWNVGCRSPDKADHYGSTVILRGHRGGILRGATLTLPFLECFTSAAKGGRGLLSFRFYCRCPVLRHPLAGCPSALPGAWLKLGGGRPGKRVLWSSVAPWCCEGQGAKGCSERDVRQSCGPAECPGPVLGAIAACCRLVDLPVGEALSPGQQ